MPCLPRVEAMSWASFSCSVSGSVHLILQGAVQLPGRSRMQKCALSRASVIAAQGAILIRGLVLTHLSPFLAVFGSAGCVPETVKCLGPTSMGICSSTRQLPSSTSRFFCCPASLLETAAGGCCQGCCSQHSRAGDS